MTPSILESIVAATQADLDRAKGACPAGGVARASDAGARSHDPFADALRPIAGGPARLIAEIKRASPSKGVIVADVRSCGEGKGV